tara:strand:+ start:975 stop:1448 length:474 start_codon:yes stop_codon:yes gene_type:complete
MISPESYWQEVNASNVSSKELLDILKNYVDLGMTLYIGTDSMLYSNYCTFSCIIAIHSNELNIANYYYQKQKLYESRYKVLENKILKEVELSVNAANYLKKNIPNANIEVHIDIGDKERNATKHLVENARGWVAGMGYQFKIKPNSWASSVADWHTK